MATEKTEYTEISVGCGLLGRQVANISAAEVSNLFEGTLTVSKLKAFQSAFTNSPFYQRLHRLGMQVRANYSPFQKIVSLKWTGSVRAASSVSSSQDLLVFNSLPVSIKANSNVVYNLSPVNLFVHLPSNRRFTSRHDNWFLNLARNELEALFEVVRRHGKLQYTNIDDFEHRARRSGRKQVQQVIAGLKSQELDRFNQLYKNMCNLVAQRSADRFNAEVANLRRLNDIEEIVGKVFFRMNSIQYLLIGIDRNKDIAVIIPSITEWRRNWVLHDIKAQPDTKCLQSVVRITVTIRNTATREIFVSKYRAEVRWSHGKFCGNPEAKLYKEFPWTDVPFFQRIV